MSYFLGSRGVCAAWMRVLANPSGLDHPLTRLGLDPALAHKEILRLRAFLRLASEAARVACRSMSEGQRGCAGGLTQDRLFQRK